MQPDERRLCDELLIIAKREMVALNAGNLDEIELCLTRKLSILEQLSVIPCETRDASRVAEALSGVLETIFYTHNKVRNGLSTMLEACAKDLVGIGRGRKVHRAYQEHRGRGIATTGGTSGSRRNEERKQNHVL